MFFIIILIFSALSIAGSAAFFSVYGLMLLFSGMSTFVLIMGTSLEVGKLIATSYLYRYWTHTRIWLKTYLLIGIFMLMLLTSMGIFGLLSVGYQTDALPLKQLEQKVQLLDEEKIRSVERKKQIDNQIANLPADYSKSRIKLMNSFKSEQEQVTARINELDKETLDTKSKVIQTEAHIGPITYIAKALGLNTDDATKYLIYLIIFVFDPMAIALTLAVNITFRIRKEEKERINDDLKIVEPIILNSVDIPEESIFVPEPDNLVIKKEPVELTLEPAHEPIDEKPINYVAEYVQPNRVNIKTYEPSIIPEIIKPTPEQPYVPPAPRRIRPYAGIDLNVPIEELLSQHQYYKTKKDKGDALTQDEIWAYQAIKKALHNQGYNIYV